MTPLAGSTAASTPRRRALKSTQQKHLSFSTVSLKRDVFLCLQRVSSNGLMLMHVSDISTSDSNARTRLSFTCSLASSRRIQKSSLFMYSQVHPCVTYLAPNLQAPQELSLDAVIWHLRGEEPPLVIEPMATSPMAATMTPWCRSATTRRKQSSRECVRMYMLMQQGWRRLRRGRRLRRSRRRSSSSRRRSVKGISAQSHRVLATTRRTRSPRRRLGAGGVKTCAWKRRGERSELICFKCIQRSMARRLFMAYFRCRVCISQ